jgi:hypothetical protein
MLRTWDLSGKDTYLQQTTRVVDAEVFTHTDISPDGQQVAYSWLDDQDRRWVRFVDTMSHPTPESGANPPGNPETLSMAMAISVRWLTSTTVAACSRATESTARRPSSTP